ncbi:hypothetical protein SPRG_20598 [Saprolegnia parasitica CBS 223.65]|uniref:PH domain-containing protein n=1 Tax=Saprolegnia parasitica (strain CBS 223.65) TaxID=695850 RepID=A0A067C707_SAPPC|nr:hypothetical protein SPRG_20598 [Saprolegnia parasitica CBS 223.65]KDO26268.1 hypothetical protein SPRG_20598 [Saprolegnia parasitica CBS 223.65]|eukprot:XP_012203059.1 hypothetical protein SPRG_20598 [Saprolegnia parasitica CBS 223.65]
MDLETAPAIDKASPEGDSLVRKVLTQSMHLTHDENNASISDASTYSPQAPWTPKSLGRAKSAIIYRRNIFFFREWHMRFVSLQDDHILIYSCREKWEQGDPPDKVVRLNPTMFLSHMRVDVEEGHSSYAGETTRLFRRKLLETDELDEWINDELRQGLVVDATGSNVNATFSNNPEASARTVLEFATTNQSTFELWSKVIRRALQSQKESTSPTPSNNNGRRRTSSSFSDDAGNDAPRRGASDWISPGHDCRVTLHQSEVWCNRVTGSTETDKAESEFRRILFAANSRREIESGTAPLGTEAALSPDVLHFFADHLKRKYAVFLILALAHGIAEEYIREAHERMCAENEATFAGVGAGTGDELQEVRDGQYGFADDASIDLYDKYRTAALNYYRMNYGDPSAAEEEDAIMHLPVMLHVALIRQERDEASALLEILQTVKRRLLEHTASEAASNNESTT